MKVDHFHRLGETLVSRDFHSEPGGKGFNQAVAVSRLGGKAHFLSAVGDDGYGIACERYLCDQGVIPHLKVKSGHKTAYAVILTDKQGENRVTVFPGASSELKTPDLDDFEDVIADSSILLLQLEVPIPVVKQAIRLANRHRVPVILNPAPAKPLDREVLDGVTILTPNESEALSICALTTHERLSRLIESLQVLNKTIIVTRGKNGAVIIEKNKITTIPGLDVDCLDSTGAGDVFNGALAVSWASGRTLVEAARFANAAAALSVTKEHVMDALPTRAEVEEFIRKMGGEA
ncbi:MAG TPA: ribokinase [Acholeplasmatales bacterium]|nr:ribokinase [Acholeplasmatales bacterium]